MSFSSSSMSHPQAKSDHHCKCSLFSRAKNAQGHVFHMVEATETKAGFLWRLGVVWHADNMSTSWGVLSFCLPALSLEAI